MKMNEIVMIPVEQLEHHPENPRKDLGDLTELTESIRKNGIMQNLTVIAGHWRSKDEYVKDCRAEGVTKDEALGTYDSENSWTADGYTVVIGNRRMEAAKIAGLAEVPCVISDMDHKTQIATMLEENMQRADLTIYEQAQGFQLMMDLGYTAKDISEKTGFGETTVRRRLKMAELDQKTLREKCTQLTMDDLDRLSRIKDLDKRNELLKQAGTGNFRWKVDNAVEEEERDEKYQLVKEALTQAGCSERGTNGIQTFWKDYEYLPYDTKIILDKWNPGDAVNPPEDDRQLYFYKEYNGVRFWAEKRKAEETEEEETEPTEEEIAKQEERKKAEEAWSRLEEIEKHAQESRKAFLDGLAVKQKDSRKALEWMMIGLVATNNEPIIDLLPEYTDEEIKALPEPFTETDMDIEWTRGQILEDPQLYAKVMDGLFFNGEDSTRSRWNRTEKPKYCRNISMITGYEWLEDFGYKVSDDERAYLDGTLDCYGEAEA